jgi:CubicO group peptidase (beta-lactamase class C family)
MRRIHLTKLIPLFITIIFLFSCNTTSDEYTYQIPEQTNDGWETASLESVGINPDYLVDMMNRLNNYTQHRVHSILIIRQGKLVFEEYFSGLAHPTIGSYPIDFDRETWHVLSSVTKSYTSALLGIAINKGFIQDVNQKVFDFFPELAHLNNGQKRDLSIEHMITMSSGLEWDQTTYPILDERNDISQIQRAENPWDWYLGKPLVTLPGEAFLYSEGCINVVGEIIKRASGIRLDKFAEQYLFTPLGINRHWWYLVRSDTGWIWASGDLRQLPRDMAKFGQLYLQKGKWNGQQIVPSQWVNQSAERHYTFNAPFWSLDWGMNGYGYAWWIKKPEYGEGAFCATGWGDQSIMVLPSFDLVAVFTGGSYYQNPILSSHQMMIEYILPAIQ